MWLFDWHPAKAARNERDHGVSFREAATVFTDDEFRLDDPDADHSDEEPRWFTIGRSLRGRVLAIAYTTRESHDVEITWIISARPATRREQARYASGLSGHGE